MWQTYIFISLPVESCQSMAIEIRNNIQGFRNTQVHQ